jgi:subtilisin family serine protease
MKKLFVLLLLTSSISFAKTVRIAVIDTGFDFKSDWATIVDLHPFLRKPKLCPTGHKDFTGKGIQDNHGHGTHIAGIIAQYANNADYCLIILKFFNKAGNSQEPLLTEIEALKEAIKLNVDVINFSGGGGGHSKEECSVVKYALDKKITMIAAAGNESKNINKHPYFPAMCDSRVKTVANITKNNQYSKTSNFTDFRPHSKFLFREKGEKVQSIMPNNTIGYMTGTSQATAIRTGKLVKNWKK